MTESNKRTAQKLSLLTPPIASGLMLCVVSMALHSIRLYREIEFARRFGVPAKPLHVLLILAFVFSATGLLLRSRVGLTLSIFGLGFVLLLYAGWYEYSYRLLKVISEGVVAPPQRDIVPPHPLGLVDATWLDIAILFAVVIMLAWQVKFLISTLRRRGTM